MKRAELKEIVEKSSDKSRFFLRQYPSLYRDLQMWEYYLDCVRENRTNKIRAPKDRARYAACAAYGISEKTFYSIRTLLRELCEDL